MRNRTRKPAGAYTPTPANPKSTTAIGGSHVLDDRVGVAGDAGVPAALPISSSRRTSPAWSSIARCAPRPSATTTASGSGSRAKRSSGTSLSRKASTSPTRRSSSGSRTAQLNASYNCLDRHLETQPDKTAIIFEADDGKVTPHHLQGAARARVRDGERAQVARHQQRRPRHHLHADVDRSRSRDAGVRPHRRGPLGGVRRLLGEKHPGAHHRRRRRRGASPPTSRCAADARSRSRLRSTKRSRWAAANRSRTSSSTGAPAAK